jgi:putative endonuclease
MSRKEGHKGEDLACEILERDGYQILARNYRSRFGEIDIVARKTKTICFVEVKYKQNQGFGLPQEAVTKKKLDKIFKTAKFYLYENDFSDNQDWQIDVLAINKNTSDYDFFENVYVER